jgi:uncharacterized protein YozE (UPF0346 family)
MKTFKAWIKQFKGAYSPFGDLADDIISDNEFPKSNSYKTLRDYFGYSAAAETFEKAWKYYKGEVDTKAAHYQLGLHLEFARMLLMSINCTPELNYLLLGKQSSYLHDMQEKLIDVKSLMENVIYDENYKWANLNVYFGISDCVDPILQETLKALDSIVKKAGGLNDVP